MKYKLLGFLMSFLVISLTAQSVSSYKIKAQFFPDNAQMYNFQVSSEAFMRADAMVEFSGLPDKDVIFYLHGELKIDSIVAGDKKIDYKSEKVLYYDNYNLVALQVKINVSEIADKNTLRIYYSGFLNPSRARSLSDYMHINKNEGVFLRSFGYSLWFPIFSDSEQAGYEADFKEITIELPAGFKCIVAGELMNESVKDGIYKALWRPGLMNVIDLQCTAQNFKVNSKENVFVYYMSDYSNSQKVLDFAVRLKKLYSENLRSVDNTLPFYIMEMPMYGDISSANIVGISTKNFSSFDDGIYSKLTIAHELVHPFVKIPVTIDNPFYAFVIEGIPSFFQVYALKKLDGDAYDLIKDMKNLEAKYTEMKRTGKTRRGNTLPAEKAILDIKSDEIGNYKDTFVLSDRVWLFFYSIWNQMGDERFDKFIKELFQFNTINYESFEMLVLKYIPGYQKKLYTWLNKTEYPDELRIVEY